MTRRLGVASALLLIVLSALAAAVIGYVIGSESKPPVETAPELVLAPAPTPPRLPAYDPGSGWFALPKPPSPTPVESEGEVGDSSEESEGGEVIEEAVKEETGGGASGRRCFGIGFGNHC